MNEIINLSTKLYSNKSDKELSTFKKRNSLFTGIEMIDKTFNFPYGYYLVMGNPGVGKSWFALWLTKVFFIFNNENTVFFSLEMNEQALRSRMLQAWSGLTKSHFEAGGDISFALDLLKNDMIIVDTFFEERLEMRTPQNFERMVDEYYKYGYRIFHFDHLHEIEGATDNYKSQEVTGKWGAVFQRISKKYDDIWLFIFAQPNAEASKKRILRRTDILGSKSITYKADYILSINKGYEVDEWGIPDDEEETEKRVLYLDKTRYTDQPDISFPLKLNSTGNFVEQ